MLVADLRVDVNVQGQLGYRPLHTAVGSGRDIKALLEKRDDGLLMLEGIRATRRNI